MDDSNIQHYQYTLPTEKIALYPLEQRDHSKLLVYQNGKIRHTVFGQLPELVPADSFLFFNNTKVIPARLHFQKETGADIEIFLLGPASPSSLLAETILATETCSWHCTIGNLKRWPDNLKLVKQINDLTLKATLIDREKGLVQFQWSPARSFAEVINIMGETPLPPYLKRNAEISDRVRYQTIYSKYEGAVAAPTAGLHFTNAVFEKLHTKKIGHDFLTLHVSAGTFQPIKVQYANEHVMHREQLIVTRKNIENLLSNKFIIPVGTTSMRTLESLYWFGVKLLQDKEAFFNIQQEDPYIMTERHAEKEKALNAILQHMDSKQTDLLTGETSIFIKPGYRFKLCNALITNFHQPASTLILLVAAFTGVDWKIIYQEALENNYRFLSYGDSSLLFPHK